MLKTSVSPMRFTRNRTFNRERKMALNMVFGFLVMVRLVEEWYVFSAKVALKPDQPAGLAL